jgi:sugar lactone lactonase YvrE/mono/diheme cytochrome c family protein
MKKLNPSLYAFAGALMAFACKNDPNDHPITDAGNHDEALKIVAGLELYSNEGCAACHCNDGRGGCNLEAPNVQNLDVNALEANLRFAATESENPDVDDPVDPHPLKLAESTDDELSNLALFLGTLSGGTPTQDTSFIGRGYNLYVTAGCIECHLTSAQGSAQGGIGSPIAGTDPDTIYQALIGEVQCHPLVREPPAGAGCSILGHYETNAGVEALTDIAPPDADDERLFLAYFLTFVSPPPPPPGSAPCNNTPGTICTVAGNGVGGFSTDDVPADETLIYYPQNIELTDWDKDGTLDMAFSDWNNHRIRLVYLDQERDGVRNRITSLAGTGKVTGDDALNHPLDLEFDATGALLIASWHNQNVYRYRKEQRSPKERQQVAGVCDLVCDADTDAAQQVIQTQMGLPGTLAAHPDGRLFIGETHCGRIRVVTSTTDNVQTFQPPQCITAINLRYGRVNRFAGKAMQFGYAGDGGPATEAMFNIVPTPVVPNFGISLNPSGTRLYVADSLNNVIRVIHVDADPPTIHLFAGTPGQAGFEDGDALGGATFNFPTNVDVDQMDRVYVADSRNHAIRRIDPATGQVVTIAGTGRAGYNGENHSALETKLNLPGGVGVHPDGRVFIADTNNNRIRVIVP